MSKRFSLVLSDIPPQRNRNHGAFQPVVFPTVTEGVSVIRNGGSTQRRNMQPHTIDLEAPLASNARTTTSPTFHQHHVVALDVPTLPKRSGLRNCLLCTACLWIWVVTVVICAVAFWRPEFALVLRASHRVPEQQVRPPRMAAEINHCTFSVLATVGRPSRLQLAVSLASTLAPSVDEEDITLHQLSPGLFEVEIACCTRELYLTLKREQSIDSWNYKIGDHYGASVVVSRSVEVTVGPRTTNASF